MADPVTIGAAVEWGMNVAGWVASPIISELLRIGYDYLGFDASKLKELETKVLLLERVMEVVDKSFDRPRLEQLFKELKSAFFEAEDILDDIEYHRLEKQIQDGKLKIDDGAPPRKRDRAKKMFQSFVPKSSPLKNKESGLSKKKLKESLEKIENVINDACKILERLKLGSVSNANWRQTTAANSRGAVTTSAPPLQVIGRDEDRDKIIEMLHESQPNTKNNGLCYSVIGIHGIPGSGKSTIAQHVYASEKEDIHFDLFMWIHVSQNFSVQTIFKEMLEGATGNPCPEFSNPNTLQENLEKELSGKRFLLVLDDVWCNIRDVRQLEELQHILSPLRAGEAGSKILATSRAEDALKALGATKQKCIPISDLKDTVFFELFMHYALGGATINGQDRTIFETTGAEIAKKLKGSPLAARTVGGQLRIRPKVEFWRRVRDRDLLNETMGALWWSYQHLDEQVRRCFAFCSIFPRGHRLERDELVYLWVAEGFIKTSTNAGEEMEDVGHDYFDELVSTSFLQLGGRDYSGKEYYSVHDLLHDLAEKVAGSDCFRIEKRWTGEVPPDVRHLFVESYNEWILTEKDLGGGNVRTLIINITDAFTRVEEKSFEGMLKRLPKLRVLTVRTVLGVHLFPLLTTVLTVFGAQMFPLPASIGQLKHLRYLAFPMGLSHKLILPGSFAKLYHMQVLALGGCSHFAISTGEDVNFINLRHVITLGPMRFQNIGRLTSLQTIPEFVVRKEQGYELHQLKHLNKLQGKLQVHCLENVESKEEALEANLAAKERLTGLALKWYDVTSCNPEVQAEVLEGLSPPMGLERMEIRNYHGLRYPSWMVGKQNGGPKYLQELSLDNCSLKGPTPELHFIHLRSLTFRDCTLDALPDNMEQLTSLRDLLIDRCLNIQSLPRLPQSLERLKILECNDDFMRSCERTGHPNWQNIENIPNKVIQDGNGLEGQTPCVPHSTAAEEDGSARS